MNVIGRAVSVARAEDPSKVGLAGTVVLETSKTLLLKSGDRKLMVEKKGSLFVLSGIEGPVEGSTIMGRLQDRWGRTG
ncbi:MAG: ribonuclease P protein subunit [archaeon]|nr:MAG: ribonuclease P protein subunit [archaeon]